MWIFLCILVCNFEVALSLQIFSRRNLLTYGGVWSLSHAKRAVGEEVAPAHLYLYGEVDSDSCLELSNTLALAEEKCLMEKSESGTSNLIHLHVQSPGGALTPALHVCDVIDSLKVPVHSFVEGTVASAASLITMLYM